MIRLVKTGYDIEDEMRRGGNSYDREGSKKYLILPEGLDALKEMLKEGMEDGCLLTSNKPCDLAKAITSSVFARFKKENNI
jgi:hypothetical protein